MEGLKKVTAPDRSEIQNTRENFYKLDLFTIFFLTSLETFGKVKYTETKSDNFLTTPYSFS